MITLRAIAISAIVLICTLCPGEEPKIVSMEPAALIPGKEVEVTFKGENLREIADLWTSFPSHFTLGSNSVRIKAAGPVGIGAIRVATAQGLSAPFLIMIDDVPSVKESDSNQTISAAQELKPPIAVDGACNDVAYDYFRFQAKKNQQLSIETVAQRLGSEADTVVRVMDEHGREFAFCDDGGGVGRDSRCVFKAPATANYILEVRDMNYSGGQRFRYRLRIGDFPLITGPFPPVIERGHDHAVELLGIEVRGLKPVKAIATSELIHLDASRKGGSGYATLLTSDLPEAIESEPNDKVEAANLLAIPGAVSGRFEKDKDRDLFRFETAKDQALVIAARTRSLNSPCDVFMQILKSDGSTLVEANVTGADEGTITNTFKEAGTYYVELQELTKTGAPDYFYRLEAKPVKPGYSLSTEATEWKRESGESFSLKVSCLRRDYQGPIKIALKESTDFTLEADTIEEKKNEATLKLKPKDSAPRAKILNLRLTGTAKVHDAEVSEPVSTQPALRKSFSKMQLLPLELDGLIAILIAPPAVEKKQ